MSNAHFAFTRLLFVAMFFLLTAGAAIASAADDTPSQFVKIKKLPVILDTDIGDDIDDTWALVMLLKSPQFDVKLITTTCGKNVYRSKIIAKLLTVARRTDIPDRHGRRRKRRRRARQQPWVKDFDLKGYKGKVHKDGVAGPDRHDQRRSVAADDHLHRPVAHGRGGARASAGHRCEGPFRRHARERLQGLRRRQAVPEWNIKAAVPAAQKALSAPWRQAVITPLDTCGLVNLSGKRFQKLAASNDPLVKALIETYRIWAKNDKVDASSTLFDTVAVYLALPGPKPLLEMKELRIKVTDDGMTRDRPGGGENGGGDRVEGFGRVSRPVGEDTLVEVPM